MRSEPVILFCFAGRQANLELQISLVRRILDEHPNTYYHIWNLSQTPDDDAYIRGLSGERTVVHNQLHGHATWKAFNEIYKFYAVPAYQGHWFVKMDEDVIFLETAHFGQFVQALTPGRVCSADVINNGACTAQDTRLWKVFADLYSVPLLDIHESTEFWSVAHNYAIRYWPELIDQGIELLPTQDWLSINLIGYGWEVASTLARRINTASPKMIAGRGFRAWPTLGDEGVINTLPRTIVRGFRAVHLYFGPQRDHLPTERVDKIRAQYADLVHAYLLEH